MESLPFFINNNLALYSDLVSKSHLRRLKGRKKIKETNNGKEAWTNLGKKREMRKTEKENEKKQRRRQEWKVGRWRKAANKPYNFSGWSC